MKVELNQKQFTFVTTAPVALQTGSFKAIIDGKSGWMIPDDVHPVTEEMKEGQTRRFVPPADAPAGAYPSGPGKGTSGVAQSQDALRQHKEAVENQGTVLAIAKVCHQANKAWCEANGDNSQKDWDQAEQWQRDSAIKGVEFALANPDAPAGLQHQAWMAILSSNGWKHGPVKSSGSKTHPSLVPFEQLPWSEQAKDHLFQNIVKALKINYGILFRDT